MKAKTLLTAIIGAVLGIGLIFGGTAFAQHGGYGYGMGMMGRGGMSMMGDGYGHYTGTGPGKKARVRGHKVATKWRGSADTCPHAIAPQTKGKTKGKIKRK